MKISFVLGHELPFPPEKGGGVNSLLDGLTKALAALGHEVTAYSPQVKGRPDEEVRDGVKHIRVQGEERKPSHLKNFFAGLPYARRVKKVLQPCDVLSCHLLHGFLFARTVKARVVTHTIHRDPKKFLYLFSSLNRIYTGSDAITERAADVVPSLAQKFKTVYNCVDFDAYPKASPLQESREVRFLFVGRFSEDKGLATLVTAFCAAARSNPNIRLKTVGPMTAEGGADPQFVERLKTQVTAAGLEERINFVQPIFDRAKLDEEIRNADVVVLPSIGGETLNMSILECMRIGRALLISDLAANAPLNKEGETGFFAKAGDSDDWTEKILHLASDKARLKTFGENAYRYGLQTFSCKGIAAAYISDFNQLLTLKKQTA